MQHQPAPCRPITEQDWEAPVINGGCGTVTVTNDAVYPLSPGDHTITWTASDALSNSNSCEQTVTVVSSSEVTFTGSLTDQCIDNTSYTLTGGSPAGGTYSGPGVTGTNFDASTAGIGTKTINYTYTFNYADGTSCQSAVTNTIKVNPLPTFNSSANSDISCFGGSDGKINVHITSADTNPYTFSTNNGDDYTRAFTGDYPDFVLTGLLPAGTYKIRVKDSNQCQSTINP